MNKVMKLIVLLFISPPRLSSNKPWIKGSIREPKSKKDGIGAVPKKEYANILRLKHFNAFSSAFKIVPN